MCLFFELFFHYRYFSHALKQCVTALSLCDMYVCVFRRIAGCAWFRIQSLYLAMSGSLIVSTNGPLWRRDTGTLVKLRTLASTRLWSIDCDEFQENNCSSAVRAERVPVASVKDLTGSIPCYRMDLESHISFQVAGKAPAKSYLCVSVSELSP